MIDPARDTATLQPGDMIRLKIWREPDFSGDYVVDEHGMAVLPRLGAMQVTGVQRRTEATPRRQYREYLNNPSIEITPLHRIAIVARSRIRASITWSPRSRSVT